MDITCLRETFSKATIVIDGNMTHVVYADTRGFVTEEFDENKLPCLLSLLRNCESFQIHQIMGRFTKFSFEMKDTPSNRTTTIFAPLKEEVHLDIETELQTDIENGKCDDFFDFMDGVDFKNESEVIGKFLEWMEFVDKKNGLTRHLARITPFRRIFPIVKKFDEYVFFESEVFDDFIEIYFQPNSEAYDVPEKLKALLIEAIELCSFVSIEVESNKVGALNLGLFE